MAKKLPAYKDPVDHLSSLVLRFRMMASLRLAERAADGDADAEGKLPKLRERVAEADAILRGREAATRAAGVELPLLALAERFSLAPHEVDLVALALTPWIDPGFKSLVADFYANRHRDMLDVERAITILGDTLERRIALREALTSEGTLVRERLLHLEDRLMMRDPSLFEIRLSPSAVNALTGRTMAEPVTRSVAKLVRPVETLDRVVLPEWKAEVVRLVEGYKEYADRLDEWGLEQAIPYGRGLVVMFSGPPGTGKTLFSHALAKHIGRPLLAVQVGRLMDDAFGAEALMEQILFEAKLHEAILFFDECEPLFSRGSARFYDNLHVLERFEGVILMATNQDVRMDPALERRITYHARFAAPGRDHREAIWTRHLPDQLPVADDLNVSHLAERYEITGGQIKNAVLLAVNKALAGQGPGARVTQGHLRAASQAQLRHRLDEFADELRPDLCLDDLILPEDLGEQILEVLTACKHHTTLLHEWGMGRRLSSGRGVVVLFDGPPGTGKTLACEVLAAELGQPIQRIHMAQIVSKWVGETEKHIQKIFKEARSTRAVLLFDEADALFGSRVSDVSSANDRYANMETNQLLSEIERYDGVVFLTSNLETNIDPAFKRRIHYRVTFEEPEAEERTAIWRRLVPPWLPTEGEIDFELLGEAFDLPGGNIKNAVLRSCYHALGLGESLTMESLLVGAEKECRSAGRLFRAEALHDW